MAAGHQDRSGELRISLEQLLVVQDEEDTNDHAEVNFDVNWTVDMCYSIDAPNGGPPAYRVSKLRLRRRKRTDRVADLILNHGCDECDALDSLAEEIDTSASTEVEM